MLKSHEDIALRFRLVLKFRLYVLEICNPGNDIPGIPAPVLNSFSYDVGFTRKLTRYLGKKIMCTLRMNKLSLMLSYLLVTPKLIISPPYDPIEVKQNLKLH